MNFFNLAFVGWLVLVIALSIGAYLLGAKPVWIGVGALAFIGIGVIVSANKAQGGPRL